MKKKNKQKNLVSFFILQSGTRTLPARKLADPFCILSKTENCLKEPDRSMDIYVWCWTHKLVINIADMLVINHLRSI